MKLSTKGRYAVMAMIDITQNANGSPVALYDISQRQQISLSYLEQLFSKLRKNGLVVSVRGPGGGYKLAANAQDIDISTIISAVDEPITAMGCDKNSDNTEGCCNGNHCVAHSLWSELTSFLHKWLRNISLADVRDGNFPAYDLIAPSKAD